ncbi:spermine oxidase-like isoform X2 [Tubulanus polymorphus]|uniref:spermine oxidase-like isoform X2 n=1 Tax=Tubulanus polymorphus TaxID=672921 RepID=UPI003DA33821
MATDFSPKVIIIGGGIAGLAAADLLIRQGCTDVKILEATSRTGGRIWTIDVQGQELERPVGLEDLAIEKVELGANWIHGVENNPIYRIADEHDLLQLRQRCNLRNRILPLTEDGEIINQTIVKEIDWEYGKLMQKCEDFFNNGEPAPHENESVGEFLDSHMLPLFKRYKGTEKKHRELLYEQRKSLETCISGCHDLQDLSLAEIGSYEELPGIHYTIPPGFERVIDVLKESIPSENVLLNHPVRTIFWEKEQVCAECMNGEKFYADHVIVSISLGCLKDNSQRLFAPSLPPNKILAIQRLEFGVVDKIILEFKSPIIDSDLRMIQLLWDRSQVPDGDMKHTWYRKIYSFEVVHDNVLVGWLSGKEAMYMESLSEEEVGRACVEALRKFLKRSDIPLPVKVTKTAWYHHPYSRGAYTYIPVGSSIDDIEALQEPICTSSGKPLLLFAGEATHTSFYSTTHGALLSGQREAERIINHYMVTNDSEEEEPHVLQILN